MTAVAEGIFTFQRSLQPPLYRIYSVVQAIGSYFLKGVGITATEELLSVPEVGSRLGVSIYTVRRWIKSGDLPAYRPGKEYRIRESDLEKFLEAHGPKAQASAPPEESGHPDQEKLVEWFDAVMKTSQPLSEQSDEAIAIVTEAAERAARGEPALAAGFLEDESPERNAIAEALARMLTEAEKRRHAEKSGSA